MTDETGRPRTTRISRNRAPAMPPPGEAPYRAIIGYLRVSTADQDNEKFKHDILKFANDRHLGHVEFHEEKISGKVPWRQRELGKVLDTMFPNAVLIVPELSRLGRSTLEVLEILAEAKRREIIVYSVKENLELNGDSMQAKIMSTLLALFAELERAFISIRTTEALRVRKAAGIKLGRPKGPGKSKLDPFHDAIIAELKLGVPKTKVASHFHTTEQNLANWLKKNQIKID